MCKNNLVETKLLQTRQSRTTPHVSLQAFLFIDFDGTDLIKTMLHIHSLPSTDSGATSASVRKEENKTPRQARYVLHV